ncbi:MAG: hypothetical protein AAGD01_08520 [Acidobacteriota bacterium]
MKDAIEQEAPLSSFGCSTPRDRQNQRRTNLWTFAWISVWLLMTFGFKEGILPSGPLAFLLVAATVPLGIAVVLAHRKFLREADELRRKIELEALALSVGVTLVGSFTYWLMEAAGIVEAAELDKIILLTAGSYVLGTILGFRRYR